MTSDPPPSSPTDLSIREARDRFLDDCRVDSTDRTVRSYRNRLTQFCKWCEERQVKQVDELNGFLLDEYRRSLTEDSPVTIKGKMSALKQLIGYLERIEAVEDDLEDKVPIPTLSRSDERSEVRLDPDDGTKLISFYRNSLEFRARVKHTALEVFWFTGCRMSGLRALDLGDYDSDSGTLHFVNRPDTDTRLKNGQDGERAVGVPEEVVKVIDEYVARERPDKRDEYGRKPLISCRQGRPSNSSIRAWAYLSTQPCVYQRCPHDRNRDTCSYRRRNHASQCPSSRSPHQIRSGSITWQLNQGIPIEEVAERVNSSPDVIRRHYDLATSEERLEERRRKYMSNLSLSNDE